MVKDVTKVGGSQPNVQRQQNRTQLQDTIIGFEKPMAVVSEIGYHIALPNPQGCQSIGVPVHALAKLRIRQAPPVANNPLFLREEPLGPAQEHEWSQGNYHRRVSSES